MAKTSDRLLEGIKRRVILPASQPLLDDADMLEVADDIIEQVIVPLLLSVRQDFLVTTPVLVPIVANQDTYDIPYRSIGRGLRTIKLVDSGGSYRDLVMIDQNEAHLWTQSGTPEAFYFQGDKIKLVPLPTVTGSSIEMTYNLAPSRLVLVDQAAVVTGTTPTTVSVSTTPAVITTGTVVDFIQARSGNSILGMDATVTNSASNTLDFAANVIPASLGIGDYVSVYQTTPVLPIPNEAYPLLETSTAKRILNMIGDFEGAKALGEEESDAEKRLKMLLEPRLQGEPTKIVAKNTGLLAGRRSGWRRGIFSQ